MKKTRSSKSNRPLSYAPHSQLPAQRQMTVVAQDPAVRRPDGTLLMATISVPAEDLVGGPTGYRVQVIDYDSTTRRFSGLHELPASYDLEPAAWKKGQQRIVGDLCFHAQNVYGLVMKTLARFEFALGRRLGWSFGTHQLKIAPQGMYDANAFYSPHEEGLVFGYFEGLSGGRVYTSLSHDIVVHETTHALLDAVRERYMDPSNPDQAAFHEGFADVIALLSVFSLPEVVGHLLRANGTSGSLIARGALTPDALRKSALFGLADEMGREVEGLRGGALRRSAELPADPNILKDREFLEPHRRGEVFVAAVINAFIHAWARRIERSGPRGQSKYALERVVEDGADIADTLATIWIRALDYMPPVHLEFGDALSAALTGDVEARPNDSRYQLRKHLLEQFKRYGIIPASRRTVPADIWEAAPPGLRYNRVRFESMRTDKDEVFRFIWDNRDLLKLRTGAYTEVLSVRPCVRVGIDGFVLRETVAEYYQVARLTPAELKAVGIIAPPEYLLRLQALKTSRRKAAVAAVNAAVGDPKRSEDPDEITTPLYGGGILVFGEYGELKYHVHNDVFGKRQNDRLAYLWEFGFLEPRANRARYKAARLSSLHRLRATDARRYPAEGW